MQQLCTGFLKYILANWVNLKSNKKDTKILIILYANQVKKICIKNLRVKKTNKLFIVIQALERIETKFLGLIVVQESF